MRGRAALRRDDHVAVAVLLVDERLRARLAGLAALRRQEKGLRASLPPVADLAAGLPVALHVLLAVQGLGFAHWILLCGLRSRLVNLTSVLTNRSAPPATVTPVLIYPDVRAAVAWLESAFGFGERVRIGDAHAHNCVSEPTARSSSPTFAPTQVAPSEGVVTQLIKIKVPDVDAAFARARDSGARVLEEPTTYEYGERSGVVEDLAGHRWELTETVRDVEPEEWGGVTVAPW